MSDYQYFDVTATLLTPLHIGSGNDLLNEYDYAIYNKRTWRINERELLNTQDINDPKILEQLMQIPPARLLDKQDYDPKNGLYRYVIRGTPRSAKEGAQVREQIKDVYDQPYLPGSSLKGAIRTALAWVAWRDRKLRPEKRYLNRNRKFAAQEYERELFSIQGGKAPNHDLFRALQISDSAPVDPNKALMLVNARVLHQSGKPASPIEMEALRPDTTFRLTIKVDSALFSNWAQRQGLKMKGKEYLQNFGGQIQHHTKQRLREELKWFAEVPHANSIRKFYKELQQVSLPPNMCCLQLGWGTGWDDKTFGSHLREDSDFLEGILSSPRDGGYGIARKKRREGDIFPKSRRVLMKTVRNREGQIVEIPHSPLGWILLEMEPHKA